ncbi:hypothetical protein ABT144_38490, partial [Streptomyces sp. NPDC002039]|uniref:hypothetical protein n=1 Tax=Streptomyces sp. NPDC002039 TaxID=3154660 RepID=UPI00332DFADC
MDGDTVPLAAAHSGAMSYERPGAGRAPGRTDSRPRAQHLGGGGVQALTDVRYGQVQHTHIDGQQQCR